MYVASRNIAMHVLIVCLAAAVDFVLFTIPQESKSFAVNIFKGQIATSQVFPYPSGKLKHFTDKLFFNIDDEFLLCV